MTTLTTSPLAPLLDRLFDEADAASPATSATVSAVSAQEWARLIRSKTGYLDVYTRLKDFPLEVSRETGTLLYMLARSSARARSSSSGPRSASRRCTSRQHCETMVAAS